MQLNVEIFLDFHCQHSPEANCLKPMRVDGNSSSQKHEGVGLTCVRGATRFYCIRSFFLLLGFFLYLVGSVILLSVPWLG